MDRKIDLVMEICAKLAEQENLHVTVYESAKGAGVMGISALLGGLLGGKNGLLIGGAIGSAAGYYLTSDFKSIPQIIREDMTDNQKRKLYKKVNALFKGVSVKDVSSAMMFLTTNPSIKSSVLSIITDFLRNDLNISI